MIVRCNGKLFRFRNGTSKYIYYSYFISLKNINFFLSFVFIEQGAKDAHVLGYAYETYPLSNYDFIRRYCFVC